MTSARISLSTHVLDTARGCPAAGVGLTLAAAGGGELFAGATDAGGRCVLPVVAAGRYTLAFAVADYFRGTGVTLADPPFLDVVRIDFGVEAGAGHTHVPLLVAPYAFSTYRGS